MDFLSSSSSGSSAGSSSDGVSWESGRTEESAPSWEGTGRWTERERARLCQAVKALGITNLGGSQWEQVADKVGTGRCAAPCEGQYAALLKKKWVPYYLKWRQPAALKKDSSDSSSGSDQQFSPKQKHTGAGRRWTVSEEKRLKSMIAECGEVPGYRDVRWQQMANRLSTGRNGWGCEVHYKAALPAKATKRQPQTTRSQRRVRRKIVVKLPPRRSRRLRKGSEDVAGDLYSDVFSAAVQAWHPASRLKEGTWEPWEDAMLLDYAKDIESNGFERWATSIGGILRRDPHKVTQHLMYLQRQQCSGEKGVLQYSHNAVFRGFM